MSHRLLRFVPAVIATAGILLGFGMWSAGPAAANQTAQAQPAPAAAAVVSTAPFTLTEAMIPMRDGVKLYTAVWTPVGVPGPLPLLMDRTPYNAGSRNAASIQRVYQELARDGYIFVFQDIRGRYKSEGQFVMIRPLRIDRSDPKATDETTDTYDTIDWLIKNVPGNNGRVGVFGVSYDGWTAIMAALEPHPALKAVSPQAPAGDMWMGDDFFHNGAFRLTYGFEYAARMEWPASEPRFKFDRYDTYDWYLALGPLANVNAACFKGLIPTWNNFLAHPAWDSFWQGKALDRLVGPPQVPTLTVAGWWDQEDFYGPLSTYLASEKSDRNGLSSLVVGPWNHGGWTFGPGDKLGRIAFGSETGAYYREKIQAPFFARHLKGRETAALPEATTFRTGSNVWTTYNTWPPRQGYTDRALYLREGGRLSFEPPTGDDAAARDTYVSDPARPVPYRPRPIQETYHPSGSDWGIWLTMDQRFVQGRPDVLSWETEVLSEDLTVSGAILAKLFVSTTGSDADWIVKLIDVYPEIWPDEPRMGGYQLMIASDILRARYRKSFAKPEPVKPDAVEDVTVDLRWADHTFLKGHRIMVQIQSTWFPLYDRNPQTYVDSIFAAKASDYVAARQSVYRAKSRPSRIVLPVALTSSKGGLR
ncbi:MAG: CocE/NonD family hydrolase [Candidatus Aminicenantes bacterium]|nr:CocE/NonD family hydrolase [Candidatus Aminicenantes bacterium]